MYSCWSVCCQHHSTEKKECPQPPPPSTDVRAEHDSIGLTSDQLTRQLPRQNEWLEGQRFDAWPSFFTSPPEQHLPRNCSYSLTRILMTSFIHPSILQLLIKHYVKHLGVTGRCMRHKLRQAQLQVTLSSPAILHTGNGNSCIWNI